MSLKRFILDGLTDKFKDIDVKVLNRIAATAAKTVKSEEEATAYVEDLTLQKVIDSYSDSRTTEALTSYEKKHGLKDGKKVPDDDDEDDDDGDDITNGNKKTSPKGKKTGKGSDDDAPGYVKELFSKIDSMSSELAALKGEKVTTARSSKLSDLLKDVPEKLRNRYTKDFGRMKFDTDDEFEEWLEEITPDIEDISTSISTKEGLVGRPKGAAKIGGEENKINPIVQSRIDARKAETETPAIIGLPQN